MLNCLKLNCTGCSVCAYVCPKKAIKMKKNTEGFLYPDINIKLCVNCNLCNTVCPVLVKKEQIQDIECYAVQLKDNNILKNTASGGAFYGIAKFVLDNGGVVFGVSDLNLELKYSMVKKIEDLNSLLGSKYYQCKIDINIYRKIVDLSKKTVVLISGTPCMISAIKNLKGIKQENLLTFEILCQGVPSDLVVKKHYKSKELSRDNKLKKHLFRAKDWYVGKNYLNKYEYNDGYKEYLVGGEDELCLSFQRQIFLRESCYVCKYANRDRISDFTAGDLWGYNLKDDKIKIELGCSVVLCNTTKAKYILSNLDNIYLEKIEIGKALKNNIPYHHPVKRPLARNFSYILLNHDIPIKIITIICCYRYYIKKLLGGFSLK